MPVNVVAPIRIATLGGDAALDELVAAAGELGGVHYVAAYGAQETPKAVAEALLRRLPPASQLDPDWEALLSQSLADLVLVSAAPAEQADLERREEQLKRLVQAGIPLVLVQPPCGMLAAYELEMIRSDNNCPLFPYVASISHSVLRNLSEMISRSSSPLGQLEQVIWERLCGDQERTKAAVLRFVAQDSLIIRRLLGDVTLVSAVGVSADGTNYGNLGIHLTGPNDRFARWTMGPMRSSAGATLTLVGSERDVTVRFPAAGHPISVTGLDDAADDPDWNPALDFMRTVTRQLRGSSHAPASAVHETGSPATWNEVCRTLEITDAVQRSIQKRRTIELYHEQVTEQETFKSVMAAGGCAMLLWVVVLLMIAGVVEGLNLPLRETAVWGLWPLLLFAPLAIFLGLQLLQLVFPRQ